MEETVQNQNSAQDTQAQIADTQNNRDIAAFSWTLIFAPVLLVFRRDSEFIQFHARQAIILFIVGVLIFSLPSPYSRVNILVVAAAIAGFINANQGRWYKMPLVFDLVEKGITPSGIAYGIRDFFANIFGIIKRIFTGGPGFAVRGAVDAISKARGIDVLKVNDRVEDLAKENGELRQKISFLEIEFLKERYLHGEKKSALADKTKQIVIRLEKLFLDGKFQKSDQDDFIAFKSGDRHALLGNFDENGALLLVNFQPSKITPDLTFGSWCGFGVMFTSEIEAFKQVQTILQ